MDLPDMNLLARAGIVKFPAAPAHGFTRQGAPRKIRRQALTGDDYNRVRRARLYAAGLTARGTPRKYRLKKNLCPSVAIGG